MVRIRDIVLAVVVLGGCFAAVIAHVQTGWPHVGAHWYEDNAWWLIPVLIVLAAGLFGLEGLLSGDSDDGSGFIDSAFGSSSGSHSGGGGSSGSSGGATGSW